MSTGKVIDLMIALKESLDPGGARKVSKIEDAISMVIDAGNQMQEALTSHSSLSSDQNTKDEHKQAIVAAVHKARRMADEVEALAEEL